MDETLDTPAKTGVADPGVVIPRVIDPVFKKFKPWITIVICLVCVAIFAGINSERAPLDWAAYGKWGAPSSNEIWGGKIWALLTANFMHVESWHILFNVWWFWKFGKKIEYVSTGLFYVGLIITSGIICSISQLCFGLQPGIGMSGVVYALFGYIWVMSKFDDAYKGYLSRNEIRLFVIWLFICILITKTGWLQVANAAHFSGLAWGCLVAFLISGNRRKWGIPVLGSLFLLCFEPIVLGAPWSASWQYHEAEKLFKEKKYAEMTAIYDKILRMDPHDKLALENKKAAQVNVLSAKAYDAETNGDFDLALRLCKQVLDIDPDNEWANRNRKLLEPDSTVK